MRLRFSSRLPIAAVAALVLIAFPAAAPAQEDREVAMTFKVESADDASEVNEMTATIGPEHMRLDMGPQASMVFGPEAMLMIMHEQQAYMEFTKEMMEGMRQMMSRMGRAPQADAEDDFDPTGYSFRTTGATDTVMGYEAFEVEMTGPEGEKASLWMTDEIDLGLFAIWGRMLPRLSEMAGPMMGGRRGQNPASRMQEYMKYAKAQGLPDGQVLRVATDDGTVLTMTKFEWGPFGDAWKAAPDGYQQQQMPMMRR